MVTKKVRYFEFSDGKAHKFWQLELSSAAYTVTYGRIGSVGQTSASTA